jgi:hypothetical protein
MIGIRSKSRPPFKNPSFCDRIATPTQEFVYARNSDLKKSLRGCDTADGFPVEVDGWDMAGTVDDTSAMRQFEASIARSGYRVRLADGKWHDVPNFALVDPRTNKLGYAVVWLQPFGCSNGVDCRVDIFGLLSASVRGQRDPNNRAPRSV